MLDQSILFTKINYTKKDIKKSNWAPITKNFESMYVKDLCRAAINQSDSAAMNLLLNIIGGINGMNNFAREIGDNIFRQDHDWPAESYSGGHGNINDSSSPKAMVNSMQKILLGDVLNRPQRDLLTEYLISNETGFKRIRASTPKNWIVGEKTGTGSLYGSTNDIAIIFPPNNHEPLLIGIYYTSNNKDAINRDDILAKLTTIIINEFIKNDKKLKT
jgi:beta-lactamase class A